MEVRKDVPSRKNLRLETTGQAAVVKLTVREINIHHSGLWPDCFWKNIYHGNGAAAGWRLGNNSQGIYDLFEDIEERPRGDISFSFVEIYKEKMKNLLAATGQGAVSKLAFRDVNGSTFIQGLTELPVASYEEAMRDKVVTGRLLLVDLAGSARPAEGAAGEGSSINLGLLSLGRVVDALANSAPHVPYRNSKLTMLLKGTLGGKSDSLIIACVSPECNCAEETHKTLQFVRQALKIGYDPKQARIARLEREVHIDVEGTTAVIGEDLRINPASRRPTMPQLVGPRLKCIASSIDVEGTTAVIGEDLRINPASRRPTTPRSYSNQRGQQVTSSRLKKNQILRLASEESVSGVWDMETVGEQVLY
ncbi:kinesin-like protein KIN-5D [Hyalella azteca]|uniref:Kinesin-like protein KIN-5D n=1 Tax=Hyalella azteca TaxID=294128 RepID=A0A8B7NZN6_HYAAZ|nr:kinesin-like protein KIN-5D [Hyalella azteca]